MKIRYAHTNLIARDWQRLSQFYQRVFGLVPAGPRDLCGEWVDRLTGIRGAHITGEHLALPGHGENPPTLEIFSYDEMTEGPLRAINAIGITHLAFEVDDVAAALQNVLAEGGQTLGEVVRQEYPGGITGTFVYARDIEGNILELQHWEKNI